MHISYHLDIGFLVIRTIDKIADTPSPADCLIFCVHPHGVPSKMDSCQQAYRLSSVTHGLSHGLRNIPPACFLHQSADWCRPFESLFQCINKRRSESIIHSVFYWYTGRDSNPQPSEPESDALSIEPPVHLLNSLLIIARFPLFVKGGF